MLRDFTGTSYCVACAVALVVAIGAVPLAACGIKGPLKAPPPHAPATTAPPSEQPSEPAREPPDPKP